MLKTACLGALFPVHAGKLLSQQREIAALNFFKTPLSDPAPQVVSALRS